MCGIIGMINYESNGFDLASKDSLLPMLLLNSLRGSHSTGLFGVRNNQKAGVDWVKRIGSPYALLSEADGLRFYNKVFHDYWAVVGHGRHATTGEVSAPNAHPFIYGDITLVHNGTLRNLTQIPYKDDNLKTLASAFPVDSEAAAYLFSTIGAKETLKTITGAFSFIWYDQSTKTIHAVRNAERPLFVSFREKGKGVFFSSEAETLDYINAKGSLKTGDALDIETGYLYSFPLGTHYKNEFSREKVEFKTYQYPVSKWKGNAWDYYSGDTYDNTLNYPHYKDRPLPPPPPPRSPVSQSTRVQYQSISLENKITHKHTTYRLGDYIALFPDDLAVTQYQKWTSNLAVTGEATENSRIQIEGRISGDLRPYTKAAILAGKIVSIHPYDPPLGQFDARFFIIDVKAVPQEMQDAIIEDRPVSLSSLYDSPANVFLSLKDNSRISVWRFEQMAERKCAYCAGEIEVTDAPYCLSVSDLPNPSEKVKSHGGLVCPACVDLADHPLHS